MEKFQEASEQAKRNFKIADHMLSVTFPLVKDTKLLLAIVENLFLTYTNSIAAILYHERLFKRIPPYREDSFESKFNMFKEKCLVKHNIDKSYLEEIQNIRDILIEHRKSPVEFKKEDRFVICSEHYQIKTISVNDIKKYISKAKLFIEAMDTIVSKSEGLFRSTEK